MKTRGIPAVLVLVAAGLFTAHAGHVSSWGSRIVHPPLAAGVTLQGIRAGAHHNLARASDGTVIAWGNNAGGQCNVPPGLGPVIALSGGWTSSLAVKADGSVVGWGDPRGFPPPAGLADIVAVASGAEHHLALNSAGTVFAWGRNDSGQCVVPTGLGRVVAIAAGFYHSVAVNDEGRVFAWGANGFGQCDVPPGLPSVQRVSAGGSHTLALTDTGSVVAWGTDLAGQIQVPAAALSDVVWIDTGFFHNVALKADGSLVGWEGDEVWIDAGPYQAVTAGWFHTVAQRTDGSIIARGDNSFQQAHDPFSPADVIGIAAGRSIDFNEFHHPYGHALLVLADGSILSWGDDQDGQCQVPPDLGPALAVAAGAFHSLALLADGTVRAWGAQLNDRGQRNVPPGLAQVIAIAAGDDHSLALRQNGTVVAWGSNTSSKSLVPADLGPVSAIAAGGDHSLALLTADGSVRGWGANSEGEYGAFAGRTGFTAIAAGRRHSLALRSDGTVFACGRNLEGQCNVPEGLTDVVAIAAGAHHSLALTAAGTVVAWGAGRPGVWGWDGYHHLGQSTVPVGLGRVTAIAAGSYHNLAVHEPVDNRLVPVIAWTPPTELAYGTALGEAYASATADVPGVFTYDPEPGTVLPVGTHTVTARFQPEDPSTYRPVSADRTMVVSVRPPVAVAGGDQVGHAGMNCLAVVTVDGRGSWDPDESPLSHAWELFQGGLLLDAVTGEAVVSWSLPAGTYHAVLTVSALKEGTLISATDDLTLTILSAPPLLESMTPEAALVNSGGFELTLAGGCFAPGSTLHWNGQPRPTTLVDSATLVGAIPAEDLATGTAISVVTVYVVDPEDRVSNWLAFSIVPPTLSEVDAAVVQPGGTLTVSTAPTTAGAAGVTATVENQGEDPVTVLTATYDSQPEGETVFQMGDAAFVDVQVIGAGSNSSATVHFYYPSVITGEQEQSLKLHYFDGVHWTQVRSSGNLAPLKDTTDNLDGTVSGGRFTVVFDATSTPTLESLSGTPFAIVNNTPQILSITGPTDPVPTGTEVSVTVTFATLGDPDEVQVEFVWGDGETTLQKPPDNVGTAVATHSYSLPAVYNVQVRVTDPAGDSQETSIPVVIFDGQAPVAIRGTVYDDTGTVRDAFDAGDTPLAGVTVTLHHDANADGLLDAGDPSLFATTTGPDGTYSFDSLPPGNYLVVETVPVAKLAAADRDGSFNGNHVIAVQLGSSDSSNNDFLVKNVAPTAVTLTRLSARIDGQGVTIEWNTALEWRTLGYHVHHQASDGTRSRVNPGLIPATGSWAGARYSVHDPVRPDAGVAVYWLEEIDDGGFSSWHGPIAVRRPTAGLSGAGTMTDAGFRIRFVAEPGRQLEIFVTDDLASGAWQSLGSVVCDAQGGATLVDPAARTLPHRFYRALPD